MSDIRVLESEADLIKASNIFRAAMVGFRPLSDLQPGQIGKLLEPGRTLGAFVEGEMAGTTDSAGSTLTLPGGSRVGHAAVTHVGVLPSFTRRGIATDLMRHQLRDARERGEVVATLRASEATIYGRFGYSVASSSNTVELRTASAALRSDVGVGGPVRLIEPDDAWDVLPRIYSGNHPTRPGSIDRPAVWWESQQLRTGGVSGPNYVAVHGERGAETGFVRYHPVNTDTWFTADERTVVVDDFFAPTDEAYLGLLRFLLDLDLIDRLIFSALPADDPLPWLLVDRRAARLTGARDETWLRVLDVSRALGERTYSGDGSITVSVEDPLLQENSQTFAISASGVEVIDGRAQLDVGVEAVAAALLGATPWHTLTLAGLVRVNDPAAVTTADRLFRADASPHTGISF